MLIEEKLGKNVEMPKYYNHYVDDTLSVAVYFDEAKSFHETLNNAYPSLSFSMEVQDEDGQLPFLGSLITKENRITTSVH